METECPSPGHHVSDILFEATLALKSVDKTAEKLGELKNKFIR